MPILTKLQAFLSLLISDTRDLQASIPPTTIALITNPDNQMEAELELEKELDTLAESDPGVLELSQSES